MPLISGALPLREYQENMGHHQETGKDKDTSGYEEFDDEYYHQAALESQMDVRSEMSHRLSRPPTSLPQIPLRSEKRASRIMENAMLQIGSPDTETQDKEEPGVEEDPLEWYLSSEEEGSLSDEESVVEFGESSPEGERPRTSRSSSRKSREDTARVVSFIVVGKPQIVDISIHSRSSTSSSQKRLSVDLEALSKTASPTRHRRPAPLKLYPGHAIHRLSIASTLSNSSQTSNLASISDPSSYPPRKSSRLASLVTSTKSSLHHSFLSSDPYAHQQQEEDEPMTPKTPTSMAAAAFRKGFGKTLSKAAAFSKRPSVQKLSSAHSNATRTDSKLNLSNGYMVEEYREDAIEEEEADGREIRRSVTLTLAPTTRGGGPCRYEDDMCGVIKAPPLASPVVEEKRRGPFMFGVGRRKSMKAR